MADLSALSGRPTPVRAPAGTTVRFALLVTLAVAAAASIFALVMPPGMRKTARAFDQCQVNAGIYPGRAGPINVWQGTEQQAGLGRYGQCLAELIPERKWWTLAGILALLATAALLYYVQPYWRIGRSRLVPLHPVDAADVLAALHGMAARAGLRRPPTFLVDPANPRVGGLAFGRGREPYVRLDAGLLTTFRTDPVAFRAIVLHELAHLHNRDVPITYLTVAVWRAFLLVALLPWVLSLAVPGGLGGDTGFLLESAGRIAILVVIVYATRNAVLRSRERHADARVSQWLGSTDPRECLPALPGTSRGRWVSLLRTHPDPGSRAAVLADRSALLRPGFWESFATGLALQLGWIQVVMPLLTWGGAPNALVVVMQRVWGLGLATVVIITALRTAAFLGSGGRSRWVLIAPGVGLVAGAVLGERLQIVGGGSVLPGWAAVIGGALLAVQVVLLCCWVVWVARLISGRAARWVRVTAWLVAGGTVAAFCASWLRWWSSFDALGVMVEVVRQTQEALLRTASVTWTGLDHLLINVAMHPVALGFAAPDALAMVSLVLIWLVPLWLGTGRSTVRLALVVGLIGGGAWLVFELVLRALLRGDLSPQTRASEAVIAVLTAWELGAVVLAQLVVSAVAVVLRGSLAAALFAAATTGLVGTVGIWALHATDACVPLFQATMTRCPVPLDPGFGATVAGLVTAEGTVAALLGATLGYALRRVRARDMAQPHRVRPGRIGVTSIAAISVVLLAWPRPVTTGDGPIERATRAERNAPAQDSAAALIVWARAGGTAHLAAIDDGIVAIVSSVGPDTKDLSALRAAAESLAGIVDEAGRFPGPPGGTAAEAWRAGLRDTGTGARTLVAAIDGNDAPGLERGIQLIEGGYSQLVALRRMAG